ncbi:receptor expression-enhancing protein 5 [Dermatophagoides farinae]|uniref:Receptor expression-enhancing protein n=1 Tax=Dermatophagoides farinae TaxID=6954 RepID=A0A9D4P175_DERFA|nr:hypothetical protein HUG17_9591 [Dermatophagoides farinae]
MKTTSKNKSSSTANSNDNNNHHQQQQQQQQAAALKTMFNNVMETMDRFLDTEDNLIVQALMQLEQRTNISKRFLARILLILIIGYLIFSYTFLDTLSRIIMFLYPSYRSYYKLKYCSHLQREDLVDLVKFWIFMSFFITVDLLFGNLIPLGFFIKGLILVQCVIPHNPTAIHFVYENIIRPSYAYLEENDYIRQLNQYLQQQQSYHHHNHNDQLDSDEFHVR